MIILKILYLKIKYYLEKTEFLKINFEHMENFKLDLKIMDMKAKNFRISNQKLMITYNSHIDKKLLKSFFAGKSSRLIKSWKCVHTKNFFTHVVVDFGVTIDSKNPRFFDYEKIQPIVRIAGNKFEFERAQYFLSTEDDEYNNSKTKKNKCGKIIYESIENNVHLFVRWQQDLFWECNHIKKNKIKNIIFSENDTIEFPKNKDQKLTWIYSGSKGEGVSFFTNNVTLENSSKYFSCSLSDYQKNTDIIGNAIKNGWSGDTFIVDSTMNKMPEVLYSDMLSIKEGVVLNAKSEITRFKCQHVIIFSRFLPKFDEIPIDRWDVRSIDKNSKRFSYYNITKLDDTNEISIKINTELLDESSDSE